MREEMPEMTKHTPGPWSVGHTETKHYNCCPGDWHETPIHVGPANNRGNALASVSMGGDGATRHDKESVEANAHLIAAAPDLLAAVKVAKEFFVNPGKFNPLDVERMYEAAIRKAVYQAPAGKVAAHSLPA